MNIAEINTRLREIIEGDRNALAKSLTLLESNKFEDRQTSHALLKALALPLKLSFRIAVTGSPGAGKSSFIDHLGVIIRKENKSLAILTVDPSSGLSHGSILGDKTRMVQLMQDPDVFIRPSPAGDFLGGLNPATGDSIRLLETAGYEVIIVETVGVGQSEVSAVNVCDVCIYLQLPNAGDDLQGIKKGILERADFWVIHKADEPKDLDVLRTHKDLLMAQGLQEKKEHGFVSKIYLASSLNGNGIPEIWKDLQAFFNHIKESNYIYNNRKKQLEYQFAEKWPRDIISILKHDAHFIEFEKQTLQKLNSGEISLEEAIELCRNFIFAGLLKHGR